MQGGAGDEDEDAVGVVLEPFVRELHQLLIVARPGHGHRDDFQVFGAALQDVGEALAVGDPVAEGEAVSQRQDPGLAGGLLERVLPVAQSPRIGPVRDREVGRRDHAREVRAQRRVGISLPVAGEAERDLVEARHGRGVEPVVEALDPPEHAQADLEGGEQQDQTPDDAARRD